MAGHEFIAYIDESGDDGLKKFRKPGDRGGTSQWLVLGCCVVRASNDHMLASARDDILSLLKSKKTDIHFAQFPHHHKVVVVDRMRSLPVRLTNVLSCKAHIPDAERVFDKKGRLYWYLARTLIERISWLCAKNAKTRYPRAKVVFSDRGGLSYEEFRDYLDRLKTQSTSIDWLTISTRADDLQSESHKSSAGLQFADVSARAFAEAVEANEFGNYEQSYAKSLKPIVYDEKGKYLSYGVKLRATYSALDDRQKEFFEFYGAKKAT